MMLEQRPNHTVADHDGRNTECDELQGSEPIKKISIHIRLVDGIRNEPRTLVVRRRLGEIRRTQLLNLEQVCDNTKRGSIALDRTGT